MVFCSDVLAVNDVGGVGGSAAVAVISCLLIPALEVVELVSATDPTIDSLVVSHHASNSAT